MLEKLLPAQSGRVYVALRMISGLLFAFHGAQKVFGVLTDHVTEVMTQMWIGGVIELATGLMIAVGFKTSSASAASSNWRPVR